MLIARPHKKCANQSWIRFRIRIHPFLYSVDLERYMIRYLAGNGKLRSCYYIDGVRKLVYK
jgi:hypothetical protein